MRFTRLLLLSFIVAAAFGAIGSARAQTLTVKNQFVGATEIGGDLTLWKGDPANHDRLTFDNESFLTVEVAGKIYSYNPFGEYSGPNGAPLVADVQLVGPNAFIIKDTIRCIWPQQGFDIVQDAYPVQFDNSGVIVIKVKIINHTQTFLPVQAEYLLDNMNSDGDSANDNPFIIHRYGYIRNWQDCPPNPTPSFFLAFEHNPDDLNLGTVGIGYINDTFPPEPLGLTPPISLEFGNWPTQIYYTWGQPGVGAQQSFVDEATLYTFAPADATPYDGPGTDSVTEIMRMAYGVPEFCYDHGNVVGVALYPHHITWDPIGLAYTPNPFQVETFLFPVGTQAADNATIRQTVSDPIRIVSPKPTGIPKDTTQQQSAGTIGPDGVADVHWTDSVVVLPSGCTSTIPVDINFAVKTSNFDTVFDEPWECTIDVDCAHPDTLAPGFNNSSIGCDSVIYDTISAFDNRLYDLGLQNITYASPDLTNGQYAVTITPPPPYNCIQTAPKIVVQQVDTFQSGQVIFTFTDCASNISHDTICFTAHPPIPDLTAPKFWLDSGGACTNQCTKWTVTDSNIVPTSIDRGIDSIVIVSQTNMIVSGIPTGGKYPAGTPTATLDVCVADSLLDGTIILRANDTSHNFSFDTITYCTTPDTHAPIITVSAFNTATSSWHVHVTDTQAWDRGVDSVWIEDSNNVVTIPVPLGPWTCAPKFDFDIKVSDTSQCASAQIFAQDCAKPQPNVAGPVPVSFSKGAKPVIVASKMILCNPQDSALLDAGSNFSSYQWSSGQTTRTIEVKSSGSYTVTVGEGLNCSSTSDPVTITSSPATPTITPTGPIALCAPDSAKLDAGAGFTTYAWMNNGAPISGATSETFWAAATGMYSVEVTNAAGCEGTSASVSVTINPIPQAPSITSLNGVLTSTSATTYQWFDNGDSIPGATGQSYTPTSAGSYTVTITNANGCSNTSQPASNSGTMTVSVPPTTYASESDAVTIPLILSNAQDVPSGTPRTWTATLSFDRTLLIPNGGPGMSVPTMKGDTLSVTYSGTSSITSGTLASLPFIAALGDDSCTPVTLESFSWNTPTITVTTESGTFCLTNLCEQGGTQLIDPNGGVSLSAPQPNPASNSVEINYQLIEKGETTLILYDLLGHEALRIFDAPMEPGSYTATVDLSSLAAGTYIYSLHTPTIVKSDYLKIAR